MINKISITGSSGFLGSELKKELNKKKYKLELIKTKEIIKKKIFGKNSSHFIHLGFDTRKNKCDIKLQIKIIEKIIKNSKKFNYKILFFSTTCGGKKNRREIFKHNNYQIAKYLCEKKLMQIKDPKVNFAIFRLFNLYGLKKKNENIIHDIKQKILNSKNSQVEIINPKSTRDFIFISDVISLVIKSLKYKNLDNSIFEVGTGKGVSIEQLYKTINNQLKKKTKFILSKQSYDKIKHTKANIINTKKKFKWKPIYDLRKGLSKIFFA